MNNAYPLTYYIGKWVKIQYSGEGIDTLWMKVQNVYEGKLVGTLAGNPVYPTGSGFGGPHQTTMESVLAVKK